MVGLWDNFSILVEGLSVEDTIHAFFEYIQNDDDVKVFNEGIEYLLHKQKFILVALISIEVMLACDAQKYEAIVQFIELKAIVDCAEDDYAKREIYEYLDTLRQAHLEIFGMLSSEVASA